MRLQVVTSQSRVPAIESGEIAIECGITTPTWEREARIDFSIPFFENGTRILALRTTARSVQDLDARPIGVPQGSTTLYIVRKVVPGIVPIEVDDMNVGLAMLERGELAGLANIGIVLRALIENSKQKSQFLLLPRTGALSYELMACMLPQNEFDLAGFRQQYACGDARGHRRVSRRILCDLRSLVRRCRLRFLPSRP